MRFKRRKSSIDEVLHIALARAYSPEIAKRVLSTRASHARVEVTPQGEIRTHSDVPPKFESMPVGTLFISNAAWLRVDTDRKPWTGLSTEPVDWKLSLAFLFLARDLRDPDQCQYFSLPVAHEYWKHHRRQDRVPSA